MEECPVDEAIKIVSAETCVESVVESVAETIPEEPPPFDDRLYEETLREYEASLFSSNSLVELSRISWFSENVQHYLRGCLWSPDGTCCLAVVNGNGVHIVDLPHDLYENKYIDPDRPVDVLTSAVHMPENGIIYDVAWYPLMNSASPETCGWLSSRKHEPIHMHDAFNGKIRCSYRGYDAVDEVEAALCLAFTGDGSKIFAGYKKSVKIFQTSLPGRDYVSLPIKSPASCVAINPVHTDIVAVGSWRATISLESINDGRASAVAKLAGHHGGITYLKFSRNGEMLISGARKDNNLFCWDLRNPVAPVYELKRTVQTSQRIYFDVSSSGRWLASGDTDGIVHVWDCDTDNNTEPKELQFPLHKDCCNGVSIHPLRPIIASSSGQHHFLHSPIDEDEKGGKVTVENSLIFWWTGPPTPDSPLA